MKNAFMGFFDKKRKKLIAVGVLVAIFALGYLQTKSQKVSTDRVSKVERGNVTEIVAGSDSIKLAGVNPVYSLSRGTIKEIFVSNDQMVTKGQKLFSVESNSTQTERAEAYYSYTTAVSSLKSAEQAKQTLQGQLEAGRKSVLDAVNSYDKYSDNVTNKRNNPDTNKSYTDAERLSVESSKTSAYQNFSALEKRYLEADEAIRASRALVATSWLNYQSTQNITITAPVSGGVINLFLQVGDNVDIESRGDKPVMYLSQGNNFKVTSHVSEFDIPKVVDGQKAKIYFDALSGLDFEGEVVGLDMIGNQDRGSVTYDVAVALEQNDMAWEMIKPEMTANIEIITKEAKDVLTVPRSAVRVDKGKYSVIKIVEGKTKEIEIKAGIIGTEKVEVVEGLSEGEEVLSIFEIVK